MRTGTGAESGLWFGGVCSVRGGGERRGGGLAVV